MRDVPAHFEAPGHRYTDAELRGSREAARPAGGGVAGGGNARPRTSTSKKTQFWIDEGVAAVARLQPRRRRHGVRAGAAGRLARPEGSAVSRRRSTLAVEHYGRIVRTLEKKIPVTLQMDIDNKFYDADLNAFNVVAELPARDKADEVVMIGAHFDSWHTGHRRDRQRAPDRP